MSEPKPSEKKAFLRVLSSLAQADGFVDDSELRMLHETASELQVALSERDLESRDLKRLASKVSHPSLRAKLLDDLHKLAQADDHVSRGELSVIKFFAKAFKLAPPTIPGVDWSAVLMPLPDEGDDPAI